METLEFIIYPDGRVKEMVTGIVGSSCAEVTAAIEEQLGPCRFPANHGWSTTLSPNS